MDVFSSWHSIKYFIDIQRQIYYTLNELIKLGKGKPIEAAT